MMALISARIRRAYQSVIGNDEVARTTPKRHDAVPYLRIPHKVVSNDTSGKFNDTCSKPCMHCCVHDIDCLFLASNIYTI